MTVAQPLSKQTIVAVVGSGARGAGIAQMAAAAGHTVKLFDNRPEAAAKAVEGLRAQFAKLAEKGKISLDAANAAAGRLMVAQQLADRAEAGRGGGGAEVARPWFREQG